MPQREPGEGIRQLQGEARRDEREEVTGLRAAHAMRAFLRYGDDMKRLMWALLCASAIAVGSAAAQDKSAEMNMQILRDKVKADKKLLVAANMELTDAEAKGFWPVYESYQKDLQAINERLGRVIVAYADGYNNK